MNNSSLAAFLPVFREAFPVGEIVNPEDDYVTVQQSFLGKFVDVEVFGAVS